jgi:hypothetical protein
MSDKTLYQLVNPAFTFSFAGKDYEVKKANLEKAVLYQQKIVSLRDLKESAVDLKLVAYCIFIVLKDVDPSITEDFVFQNTPADIDVGECLTTLGFMSPRRMEQAKQIEEAFKKKLTTADSLPS